MHKKAKLCFVLAKHRHEGDENTQKIVSVLTEALLVFDIDIRSEKTNSFWLKLSYLQRMKLSDKGNYPEISDKIESRGKFSSEKSNEI